jgi:hypothetical protein
VAPILFVLALADLAALGCAGATGVAIRGWSGSQGWHFFIGLAATLVTLLVHTLVLLYFLGTARSLAEAVERHGLPPDVLRWNREARRRVFPWLAGAALLSAAAAILGGGADTGRVPRWCHGLAGLACVVVNALAFVVELSAVARNMQVIESVRSRIAAADLFDVLEDGDRAGDDAAGPPGWRTGRTLVFIGSNLWLVYAYLFFAMGRAPVPLAPIASLSAAAVVAGAWMMWRGRRRAPPPPPRPS